MDAEGEIRQLLLFCRLAGRIVELACKKVGKSRTSTKYIVLLLSVCTCQQKVSDFLAALENGHFLGNTARGMRAESQMSAHVTSQTFAISSCLLPLSDVQSKLTVDASLSAPSKLADETCA